MLIRSIVIPRNISKCMNKYLLINSNKFTTLNYTSNWRGSKKHNILTFKNNFIQLEEVLLEEKFLWIPNILCDFLLCYDVPSFKKRVLTLTVSGDNIVLLVLSNCKKITLTLIKNLQVPAKPDKYNFSQQNINKVKFIRTANHYPKCQIVMEVKRTIYFNIK